MTYLNIARNVAFNEIMLTTYKLLPSVHANKTLSNYFFGMNSFIFIYLLSVFLHLQLLTLKNHNGLNSILSITDYRHTKAKSLILYGPISNPNPK